jgi:hypothetical protein
MLRRDAVALPSTLAALSIWALAPSHTCREFLFVSSVRRWQPWAHIGSRPAPVLFHLTGFCDHEDCRLFPHGQMVIQSEPEFEQLLLPIEITTNQN